MMNFSTGNSGFSQGFGGLGNIASGIAGLFQKNPAQAAMPYLNQIPGQLQQQLGPYNQFGQYAGRQLQGQIGQLLNNPAALLSSFGQGFQSSPGYGFSVQQALDAANRAAAAGGMAGSPAEQAALAQTVTGLANQDYQNYLNSVLGLYGMGLGSAQGMYGTGAQAAGQLASGLQQNLTNQAQMAAGGQQYKNLAQQSALGSIGGGVGDLLAAFGF